MQPWTMTRRAATSRRSSSSTRTTARSIWVTIRRSCQPMRASWSRRDEARPNEGRLVVLLAIDVRNTHTVVGLLSGAKEHAKVVQQWRIRTESEATADELALTIDGLIGDDSERLTGAAALSTVPSVLHEVRVMLDQYWPSVPHVLIEPGVRTGIPLLVDNPKEVGADRIVNCLAAFHRFQSAAIVIDFGSSICVDVVSAKGEFMGGAIAPGLQVSSDAAATRNVLRRVGLARPRSVLGKNTVECMQAGAVFGFAGLVDGLVGRIRRDVDGFSDELGDR